MTFRQTAQVATLDDWTKAAEDIKSGKTRLLLLHNADPVLGLPDSLEMRRTLEEADKPVYCIASPRSSMKPVSWPT